MLISMRNRADIEGRRNATGCHISATEKAGKRALPGFLFLQSAADQT
jgi:hypothetical protein